MWYPIAIAALVCYFLGNLNGAVLMSMLFNKEDVRTKGSGNAGLTNFTRNYGTSRAVFVILIDAGKTVLACLVGGLLLSPFDLKSEGMILGGLCVSLGHSFPILLGFKGGKGSLSGLSVAIVVDWRCAVLILAVFVICVLLTRYVSLGSVLGAISFALFFGLLYTHRPFVMAVGIFMGLLVVFMHRSNISRLLKGTERKFYFRKK